MKYWLNVFKKNPSVLLYDMFKVYFIGIGAEFIHEPPIQIN